MRSDCPDCEGRDVNCATCGGVDGVLDIDTGAPRKEARAKRSPKVKAPRETKPQKPRSDPAVREQQRQAAWEAKALAAQSRRMEREAAKQAKTAALQSRRAEREAAKAAKAAARQAKEDQTAALGALMGIAFLILAGILALGGGR